MTEGIQTITNKLQNMIMTSAPHSPVLHPEYITHFNSATSVLLLVFCHGYIVFQYKSSSLHNQVVGLLLYQHQESCKHRSWNEAQDSDETA
ncbi:hypothetical protein QYF36_013032 [Acer negundo]|nr:hypothetical protein QYF36_013032 [Acer negundo]